jgi:hypothetical protein
MQERGPASRSEPLEHGSGRSDIVPAARLDLLEPPGLGEQAFGGGLIGPGRGAAGQSARKASLTPA